MKQNTFNKSTVAFFITGLLFTSLTPIVSRSFSLSDSLTGFFTGIGLMLTVIALVKIKKDKNNRNCLFASNAH